MLRHNRFLLAAGLIPLPWFLFWTALAACFAPGYSSIAQHASELLQTPGWGSVCLRIAAMGSGLGFIAFALGAWRQSGRAFAVGAACWLIFGISMLSNGIWTFGHPMHGLYAVGIANLIAPALAHIELRAWSDSRQGYAVTAFVSFAAIVYLWLNLVGVDPEGYRGLTQRVFSTINSLWPLLVALHFLRNGSPALRAQR